MEGSWWDYRAWAFAADMNADGAVTITDVWLWFKWLYFMPGDVVIAWIGPSSLGRFLEITTSSFGDTGSGVTSLILWMFAWGGVITVQEQFRDGRQQ